MADDVQTLLDSVRRAARADAARLRSEGIVTEQYERDLATRFESAAVKALRVPAFAERSALLRRLAKRFVPERARPGVKLVLRELDRALRAGFELVESRRGRQ